MKQKKIGDFHFWEMLKEYLNRRSRKGNTFASSIDRSQISEISIKQLLTNNHPYLREIAKYSIEKNITFDKILFLKSLVSPTTAYFRFNKYEIEVKLIHYTNYLVKTHKWGYALIYSTVDKPLSAMVEGPLDEQELYFSMKKLLRNIKEIF